MIQRGADARFVVASSASISEPVDLWNCQLVGLKIPHIWTAANIAFQRALDDHNSMSDRANAADTDYAYVTDENGAVIEVAAQADAEVAFGADLCHRLRSLRHVRFVAYASGVPVDQAADTTVIPLVECC